jgi:hypothetical protein
MSYIVVFFKFNCLRWEVIVRFIDIDGIVDIHCLNFLFIIWKYLTLSKREQILPWLGISVNEQELVEFTKYSYKSKEN